MITPVDVLSAAVLILFVALPLLTHARTSRRARVVLPDDPNAHLRQDWQTPARRLRLACLNQPAAKQWDWKAKAPASAASACADARRRPLPVAVEVTGTSRIIRFATRQGGR